MVSSQLRLCSFNCQGVIRNVLYVDKLLTDLDIDVMAISEHWLFPDSVAFIDSINTSYKSYARTDAKLNPLDPYRRGKGGVALMWKKTLDACVTPIDEPQTCDDRVIGIRVNLPNKRGLIIFSVYLPSTNTDMELYKSYISKVDELYHYYSTFNEVIFMGDFNAQANGPRYNLLENNHTISGRSLALQALLHGINCDSLMVHNICEGPTYTFDPRPDGSHRSLIDHIVIEKTKFDLIKRCAVLWDPVFNVSDHLPVMADIEIGVLITTNVSVPKSYINWKKMMSLKHYTQ